MTNHQDLGLILTETLNEVNQELKKLLGVDRSTIFLLDRHNPAVCSVFCNNCDRALEVKIPLQPGMGQVDSLKYFVREPFDCQEYLQKSRRELAGKKIPYIAYNILALPILNRQGYPVAFVQFLNKLKPYNRPEDSMYKRVDINGFSPEDKERFARATATILSTIERSQVIQAEIKKQRVFVAFMKAIHTISQGGLDLDATLKLIVEEAKALINADRTILWLINEERNELWTKVAMADGTFKTLHLPIGIGFTGKVAQTRKPLDIPFDVYLHPDSESIQKWDKQIGYRTCNLLYLPILNTSGKLLGVMELVNKHKFGNFPEYNPETWPLAPEKFKASFSQADKQLMNAFSLQVGIALDNAKQFTTLKQQEEIQRHIFGNLDRGAIFTDKQGRIITANDKAKQLLNIHQDKQIEGHLIRELVKIKDDNLVKCFKDILTGQPQQYHPHQILIAGGKEREINLSINAISEQTDSNHIHGILLAIEETDKNHQNHNHQPHNQNLTQTWLKQHNIPSLTQENVSILCLDIRGYTSLVEEMEPEEVADLVDRYFELMIDAVLKYQGTIDKYISDTPIAIFGTSLPLENRAWHAIQTAIEMRHRLTKFNTHYLPPNQQPLQIGIAIHSGNINNEKNGNSHHRTSDTINLASILEKAGREYNCDIIISETTYQQCCDRILARELDRIYTKNQKQPISIYEVIALNTQTISPPQQQIIKHYQKARQHYLQHQFALAMSEFSQVLAINNNDKPAKLHIQRCLHWLENPPTTNTPAIEIGARG
ncbi:MAG TPA: adenylate/guanylate cyclase domain-containing protein [Cyanobacteria bacterium UBA11149]|nr:adenylate/guanylate cyclase domain-containing protein [Cyanobacteria bacterium UBA11159]HBS71103.1 adenylate/guanylate cyclase domain-containing protein [Cyanobacteria bacterium UBA11153]HBW90481.1 adenylate/guanylate cyclase domain-containing protein [Cyanobacteria bacterium UBA11149]